MNKESYEKPKLAIIQLDEDIILASGDTSPAPCDKVDSN